MKRGENLFKHGLSGSSEHRSWCYMITRCHGNSPNRSDWHLYQGAGVKVCRRWRASFLDFLADMGTKPTPRHSIERISSARGYTPKNCRWATPKEQARNTTRNRWLTLGTRTMIASDWAEELGISPATLRERIVKWGTVKALSTPAIRERHRDARGIFV